MPHLIEPVVQGGLLMTAPLIAAKTSTIPSTFGFTPARYSTTGRAKNVFNSATPLDKIPAAHHPAGDGI
jgi:hypothetical protein